MGTCVGVDLRMDGCRPTYVRYNGDSTGHAGKGSIGGSLAGFLQQQMAEMQLNLCQDFSENSKRRSQLL